MYKLRFFFFLIIKIEDKLLFVPRCRRFICYFYRTRRGGSSGRFRVAGPVEIALVLPRREFLQRRRFGLLVQARDIHPVSVGHRGGHCRRAYFVRRTFGVYNIFFFVSIVSLTSVYYSRYTYILCVRKPKRTFAECRLLNGRTPGDGQRATLNASCRRRGSRGPIGGSSVAGGARVRKTRADRTAPVQRRRRRRGSGNRRLSTSHFFSVSLHIARTPFFPVYTVSPSVYTYLQRAARTTRA